MQFLVHFPTPAVPLRLQLCIKPAQKTSLAEEYRDYLDTSFDEHLNSGPSVLKSCSWRMCFLWLTLSMPQVVQPQLKFTSG